jgi:hypothetical protein
MIKQYMTSLLMVVSACAGHSEESVGQVTQNGMSYNGMSFNGMSFNGVSFNGKSLNGKSLNGVSVNGTSLLGLAVTADSTSGPPLSGLTLIGSTWNGTTYDGTAVKLRIDSASAGTTPNSDLWFYGISYQTTTGWSPLCGVDSTGAAIQAVSVAGVWNQTPSDLTAYAASSSQFTLACRGATVAKCVELGYKTFQGYTTQLTSCIRLLRGDFCGSGNAYTVDGTELNLYDNVAVQRDTENWAPEAEWTPSGARCVNRDNGSRYQLVLAKDPKCIRNAETANCGKSFKDGAILIDELSPTAQGAIQAAQTN